MKRMTTILILSMFFLTLAAPPYKSGCIIREEPINYYDPLIRAIASYESQGDTFAFNFIEQAAGPLQIRPCRLEFYNRLTGSNYKPGDTFNFELSRKIFLYFARGKDYEHSARDWNGSGPMTIEYWKSIQSRL